MQLLVNLFFSLEKAILIFLFCLLWNWWLTLSWQNQHWFQLKTPCILRLCLLWQRYCNSNSGVIVGTMAFSLNCDKVSLAQPGGDEREAKKTIGHSTPPRKKEWSKNSLRNLRDLHKHVLCHDGSPTHELSALLFSLQSVSVTFLQSSAPDTLDRWCNHCYQVPKRGGHLYRLPCPTWAVLKAGPRPTQRQSHPPDFSCKNIKSTWGLQEKFSGTRLVSIYQHRHLSHPGGNANTHSYHWP